MKKIYILFILIVLTSIGCADENIKPSADSLLASETFDIIETLRQAYEEKNENVLQNYLGISLAENTVKYLSFEKAELSFTPRMVKITDSSVKVNLNWRGAWWLAKDKKLENRGVADLVFHRESMKLTYIDGDNPFLIPLYRN